MKFDDFRSAQTPSTAVHGRDLQIDDIPLARATFSKTIGKHKVFEWFPEELGNVDIPLARATFSEMLL